MENSQGWNEIYWDCKRLQYLSKIDIAIFLQSQSVILLQKYCNKGFDCICNQIFYFIANAIKSFILLQMQ